MVDAPVTPELAELEAARGPRPRPALGYLMVVSAASLWAINGTVSKVVLSAGLSTYRLTELRCAGAAVLFLAATLLTRPRALRPRLRETPLLLAFGLLGLALVQVLYFVAIERLNIGVALVINYLAPVWVALWARFFIHEPVRRRVWYALALALAGLTLVVELWSGLTLDGVGAAASLAGSLAYALYIILAERSLAGGRDVFSLLAFGFVIATIFWTFAQPWWSLPSGLLDDSVSLLGRIEGTALPLWALVTAVVVFGTFIPFILIVAALHHLPSTRVTVVAMVEPVVASVVAFAWLGEELGPAQIAGGVLVLAGVALAQTARGHVEPAR